MEKKYGSPMRQDGLYKVGNDKWELIYGFGKDNESEEIGWNWSQRFVGGKPAPGMVKAIITAQIDTETDKKILSGFVWKDMPVWLSKENQMNFKAAYDLAVQSNGATLPVTFKLGEDADGNPLYYEFASMDDFADFYTKAVAHITRSLEEGWKEKDAIDVSAFE